MKRPLFTWIAFGCCLATVFAVMGWMSVTALRLDRAEVEARAQAELEENVRLALWRMESLLAPLLARENARRYYTYSAFYPAERAYTRMFASLEKGDVLMPSPLLTETPALILLHFQIAPDGAFGSPQTPTDNMRDVAEVGYTTHEKIDAALASLARLRPLLDRERLLAALPAEAPAPVPRPRFQNQSVQRVKPLQQKRGEDYQLQQEEQQALRNVSEYNARKGQFDQSIQQQMSNNAPFQSEAEKRSEVQEGLMRAMWLDGELILARRVCVDKQDYVQGCWLDWPAIKEELLVEARDLLPAADLRPVKSADAGARTRRLAALPIRLVSGDMPLAETSLASPIALSLALAWGCVLIAGGAVAVLLLVSVSLSERRGAFVSAVTHELRTPLTTFRMYTEMLSEGMVTGEEKRQSYLNTLRVEANRLGHLVENVLSYARLESGRSGQAVESIAAGDLLDRALGRLRDRATQTGMELTVELGEDERKAVVRADPASVEQILFNLVDNACKYGASADDRGIRLRGRRSARKFIFLVCDNGPGVSAREGGRLFRPFCKSDRDAANSAPGVGLGLALSRRLARKMGGDLRLDNHAQNSGACFALTLALETR